MISDYEKSVVGTFTKNLLDQVNNTEEFKNNVEIYFTITKFENDIGFSLIHQETDDYNQMRGNNPDNQDISHQDAQQNGELDPIAENRDGTGSPKNMKEEINRQMRKAQLTKHGVIPEFIKIDEIYKVYTAFTQANLKNSILHQK